MTTTHTPALLAAAEALNRQAGVTLPWALSVMPAVLGAALDVEAMAQVVAVTRHRSGRLYGGAEPTNLDRRIATELRAALLGGGA